MKKFGELSREEKIAIFGEWLDGKKIGFFEPASESIVQCESPSWLPDLMYLVIEEDDSIDWSQIKPEFVCMARGSSGHAYAFGESPTRGSGGWLGEDYCVNHLTSYKRGTKSWDQSLVWRPGCGPKEK